jgi:hypothetical protein
MHFAREGELITALLTLKGRPDAALETWKPQGNQG